MNSGLENPARATVLIGWMVMGALAWGQAPGFLPGQRVLPDAHNCYPYDGRWADRLDRALSNGPPLAIEIDLIWDTTKPDAPRLVVSHGGRAKGTEPPLREYFFDKVRTAVEQALKEGNPSQWPLFTLNINDLRADDPAFFAALWKFMGEFEPWLCTAPKSADLGQVAPLDVKPLLVLTSDGAQQARAFYEEVPLGGRLRMFAAGRPDRKADNFRRWLNYPWKEVEPAGQPRAGDWTPAAAARLKLLVDDAHQRGYWIRLYTLNGHGPADIVLQGWTPSYNFGSLAAVTLRWQAARAAGVDFVASDQYEDCAKVLRAKGK